MTVYNTICSKISDKYHDRIKEILGVIDIDDSVEVEVFNNVSVMRYAVTQLIENDNSLVRINPAVTVLHGTAVTYPSIRISGDFVILFVKSRTYNMSTREDSMIKRILIYEKTEDIYNNLREGVV